MGPIPRWRLRLPTAVNCLTSIQGRTSSANAVVPGLEAKLPFDFTYLRGIVASMTLHGRWVSIALTAL